MMTPQRIDVIGAGISGLATAYYLAKGRTDVKIHVWEKNLTPGGLAGTFHTDDFTVEKFYHHLFRRDTDLQDLIREMGLGDDLIWRPAATGAYYAQTPYRLASPLDLLRFKPLSLTNRLRLGWLALHARTIRDWRALDDMSAKDYILQVAGPDVYHVVWEPLFHGKFGPHAESVSAAWLWSKLVDRGSSRNGQGHEVLGYLRGGLGRLFERLVTWLRQAGHQVHLGQRVHRLNGNASRITEIVTENETFATDVVVGCAQLPELAQLLPQTLESYQASLQTIHFLSNVCLVLTLKHPLSQFYWTNVTESDAPFVGIIEQTNWADPSAFNQKHVIYLSAYINHDDPRRSMDTAQLIERYLPSIQRLFPEFRPDTIEASAVWHAPYAQPIVHVGYRHHIPAVASPIPNLYVCTMAQIYPHDRQLSNGVAMARRTVEAILRNSSDGIPSRDAIAE